MGYFTVLFTLDCFQILHELKASTKSKYWKFQFGALWESLRFYLLHQEKQVRKNSSLLTFIITDFVFILS